MVYQLTDYKGAVVFIDLLGFGALTNGKIELRDDDIAPWLEGTGDPYNHHYLAAHLLVELRALLQELCRQFKDLKVAQLSDCFFAWSQHTDQVVRFTHLFMHKAIKRGLLCRGGMAYGQIIETERNHRLGRLILGDAVTKAVGLEKHAKGARLLTEPELITALYEQNSKLSMQMTGFFEMFENPLDYLGYDEFRWYLADDLKKLPDYGSQFCKPEEKFQYTKNRLGLDTLLIHSPKFSWNARNEQGLVHLKATSNFLSASGLLDIKHAFDRRGIPKSRSFERIKNINELVNNDDGYGLIPPVQVETDED
ncbi:MAG: hypothetical protein EOP45_06270 [Sphingobacteriaceae bacterium]|nr:MAG: hypothetical protein EOP45_06270 [Sphingobacteriaceae bacterium]